MAELRSGGVVEELVVGEEFASPSVQLELTPWGAVQVVSTHEQVLGGEHGQVFLGCRFPADPAYGPALARHAAAVGRHLSSAGVRGRISVDFAATRDAGGVWSIYALEVNLRKGGTTHPATVLRSLVPGRYDSRQAAWVASRDGSPRAYLCSDNVIDPSWTGLPAAAVTAGVAAAGLGFDHRTGTGVVLHMLAGLAIDGRLGFTAIARDEVTAASLAERVRGVVQTVAAHNLLTRFSLLGPRRRQRYHQFRAARPARRRPTD